MKALLLVPVMFGLSSMAVAAPVTYRLDAAHSKVIATWNHLGYSNPSANFGEVSGSLTFDPDNPTASSVQVTLPMSGISAFSKAMDDHLKNDLFQIAQFPEATFKSSRVEVAGENAFTVTGDLTIRGITKPVVLAVKLNKRGEHPMRKVPAIGFDATATLKRSDFGMGLGVPNVSDEVQLLVTTEGAATGAD